jgi:hypothetical protein
MVLTKKLKEKEERGIEAWGMRPWSHLVVDSPTKTSTPGKQKKKYPLHQPALKDHMLCFSKYNPHPIQRRAKGGESMSLPQIL